MKWYFCWICLVCAQNCRSWQRIMAAWLSLNSSVGPFCVCPISLKKLVRCCPALLSPMYSDLVVESVTILCCLLDQEMAPQLLINKKLEVDQELLGSWDHPASEYPWKSKSIEISVPSNLSSMSFIAWTYLSICFAASQWDRLGLALKWLSVPTAYAMSGWVQSIRYIRDPITVR